MEVEHRNIKYPRIEYRTGIRKLILPFGANPADITNKYEKWISAKESFIKTTSEAATQLHTDEMQLNELVKLINNQVIAHSKELGVVVKRVQFRKLFSKWGSCSVNGNLCFNSLLRYIPKRIIKYVVYHEMIHLIERKHNYKFWQMIEEKYPAHSKYEEELFGYWFLINKERGKK
ncbi:MAG: M48 family metallopeptidase [Ignavibacteriaceae bacterium]|nr:M48 family metallopeptidase [Ignavibacteriaceae bacterium]